MYWWDVTGLPVISVFHGLLLQPCAQGGGCGHPAWQKAAMLGVQDVAARGKRSRILRRGLCFLLSLPSGAAQAETRSALNLKKCIDQFCSLSQF